VACADVQGLALNIPGTDDLACAFFGKQLGGMLLAQIDLKGGTIRWLTKYRLPYMITKPTVKMQMHDDDIWLFDSKRKCTHYVQIWTTKGVRIFQKPILVPV